MARPREFEPDDALNKIKDAFWRLGYEGTSLQDIEEVTGLRKQSLYRLFGDKRGMYLAALNHYERNEVSGASKFLTMKGTAQQRFRGLFNFVVDHAIKNEDRRGCFLCNASVDQAQLDPQVRRAVEESMNRIRQAFANALRASSPYKESERQAEKRAAALLAAYFGLRVLIKANLSKPVLDSAVKSITDEI